MRSRAAAMSVEFFLVAQHLHVLDAECGSAARRPRRGPRPAVPARSADRACSALASRTRRLQFGFAVREALLDGLELIVAEVGHGRLGIGMSCVECRQGRMPVAALTGACTCRYASGCARAAGQHTMNMEAPRLGATASPCRRRAGAVARPGPCASRCGRDWRSCRWSGAVIAFFMSLCRVVADAPGIEAAAAKCRPPSPACCCRPTASRSPRFARAQQERCRSTKISPHVMQALIATEDQRFYEHRGIDLRRTAGALCHTLTRRHAGRLDHHAAARAQPVPRGDRPRAHARRASSRR